MKVELFVCLLAVFVKVDALVEFHFTIQQEQCIKELNVAEETIRKLFIPVVTVENSTVLNDFVRCDWLKRDFQDQNGVFNYERLSYWYDIILKTFDDEPLLNHEELLCEAVNFCGNYPPTQEGSHGENAVKVQNCIVRFYLYLKDKHNKSLHNFCRE